MKIVLSHFAILFIISQALPSSAYSLASHTHTPTLAQESESERSPEEWSRYLGVPVEKFHAFNQVLNRIESAYRPVIEATGESLDIQRLWHVRQYAISVDKKGRSRIIYVTGGVIRHPGLSEDSFALIACHELGHHLGGYPKQADQPWNSAEGQADYFATTKCMRSIYTAGEQMEYLAKTPVNSTVSSLCRDHFADSLQQATCMRSAMIALDVAYISFDMENPSYENKDPNEVSETNMKWPAAQCRLDTFLQGALCQVDKDELFSVKNPGAGACKPGTAGARPRCWYKPPTEPVTNSPKLD